jgi:anti-anti-sigma factor
MTLTEVPQSARSIPGVPTALVAIVTVEDTRTVVVLRGEADASTREVLSHALSRVVAAFDAGDVVIDLAGAEFIDTGSVRALAVCQQLLERDGRRLTFRSPSRLAVRVLGLFGLTDLIEARETAQQ